MHFAYADPPYLGCAKRYPEHPDAKRWDSPETHGRLMSDLDARCDGWALSASAASLRRLLPWAPADVRVGAWVKPFSAAKKHVRITYGWEAVIFRPGRPNNDPDAPGTFDWLAQNPTFLKGLPGAKPERFCRWVLDLLGWCNGDTLEDVFPGTGIMSRVAAQYTLPVVSSMNRPKDGRELVNDNWPVLA